ncbi:MAG TPA: porin [Opitutaceae bacterium]|nr:porin [Opitutaceae bacterium]
MLNRCTTKWLALLGGVMLAASVALAQDNKALLDALVKKGILTDDEAKQIATEVSAGTTATPVVTGASKYLQKLTFSGRFQTQFADISTTVNNAAPSAHPPATEHFALRRMYIGAKAELGDGFTGVFNYDFANLSFDAAYIEWKQSDAFVVDAGLRKVPFGYEETTSSGTLKAIERSPATRYFVESNNGRRLGAGSYHTGLYVGGTGDSGIFYNVAITNPERDEFSTGNTGVNSTPGVNNVGGSTNNNLAYWGNLGYSAKWSKGSVKGGIEGGYLPDQGGFGTPAAVPTAIGNVGTGQNLEVYGAFGDLTLGSFNLAGEFLGSKNPLGATAIHGARPHGYWVQPSYMITKAFEGVLRYSSVNSDGRGINLSDGIKYAPSGGTMNKMQELYFGGNWYIKGNDVKLQAGYIIAQSVDTVTGGTAKAKTDGFRSQLQLNF